MGARNRAGIGLPYRPARLHMLAELIPWSRFLGGSLKVSNFGLWPIKIVTCSSRNGASRIAEHRAIISLSYKNEGGTGAAKNPVLGRSPLYGKSSNGRPETEKFLTLPSWAVSTGVTCEAGIYRAWQEVTKRCRLSWLTNSALVYEPKCGGSRGISANEYSCTAY